MDGGGPSPAMRKKTWLCLLHKKCVRLCNKKRNRWIQRWLVDLYACSWEMWKRWFNDLGSAKLLRHLKSKTCSVFWNESVTVAIHIWVCTGAFTSESFLKWSLQICLSLFIFSVFSCHTHQGWKRQSYNHQRKHVTRLARTIFLILLVKFQWWYILMKYTKPLRETKVFDFQPVVTFCHGTFRWTCGRVVSAMMWVAKVLIQQWEKSQRHQARSSLNGLWMGWPLFAVLIRFVVEDFWCKDWVISLFFLMCFISFFGWLFWFLDGCFYGPWQ